MSMEPDGGAGEPGRSPSGESESREESDGQSGAGMKSSPPEDSPPGRAREETGSETPADPPGQSYLGTGRIVGLAGGSLLLYMVMERLPMMGGLLGLIGGTAGLFSPAPAVQIFLRCGSRVGLISLIGVALALVAVGGWASALQYLTTIGVVAWVLAIAILGGRSVETAVGWSVLGVAAGMGLLYGIQVLGLGGNIVTGALGPEGERTLHQMSGAPQGPAGEEVARLIRVLGRLMPAIVVVQAALISLLNYSLVRRLWTLRGAGRLFPEMDLGRWSMPEAAVWPLIASGLLLFFLWGEPVSWVLANLVLLLLFGYFLQGLAVVHFWCRRLGVSVVFRIPLYFISVALSYVIVAFGLFDLWFDFRKLRKTGISPEVESPDKEDG